MAKRFTDSGKWEEKINYWNQDWHSYDKWITYIGEDIRKVLERPGCYVVFSSKELVYVGQSNSPRHRIAQHLSKANNQGLESPWGDIEHLIIKVKYPRQFGKEAMLEKRFVRRLRPYQNSYGKVKRSYRTSYV